MRILILTQTDTTLAIVSCILNAQLDLNAQVSNIEAAFQLAVTDRS